jgi:multiple sugar transport system permease protein
LLPSLANSLLIGFSAAMMSLLAAALALYGMTRIPVRRRWLGLTGKKLLLALLLSVRLVPPVVLALPIYVLARQTGLLDTRSLLAGVYAAVNLPVAVWLLLPFFGDRMTDQEEAAFLDGASHMQIFFSILFPMLLRPFLVVGVFLFMLCWNEYLLAAYLSSDHAGTLSPWMVGQLSMKEAQAGGETEELSRMAAAAVFMALPALALAMAVNRLIARSLASVR